MIITGVKPIRQTIPPSITSLTPPMSTPATRPLPPRLVSLDAYRGLTMLAMASGGLGLHRVAEKMKDSGHESPLWNVIGYQFEHVEWVGCAALGPDPAVVHVHGWRGHGVFLRSRQAHGQTWGQMLRQPLVRSFVLVLLGVFLRSDGRDQTYFTFEDVLSQIGLGYTFLFLLWNRPAWVQFLAALWNSRRVLGRCSIFIPFRPADFDYASVGVAPTGRIWKALLPTGTRTPTRPHDFDVWFLNLFPRARNRLSSTAAAT